MRLVCMSPRMDDYPWAFYQQDALTELARQHEVFFYGRGFEGYDENDTWDDVYAKCPFSTPDFVLCAHAWLGDRRGGAVDLNPRLQPSAAKNPVVLILNKEYANLDAKLAYIRANRPALVLSHHYAASRYQELTGTPFHYWPFAVDLKKFPDPSGPKRYDLSFSGTLQNQIWPGTQSDVRLRIQQKLYYCLLDSPLLLRPRFRKWRVFWSSQSRYPWLNRMRKNWHLDSVSYFEMLASSRAVICCLSPLQLVGTRYFESMAAGALVLCEESERYDGLFSRGVHYASFKPDLSDFVEVTDSYLGDEPARLAIARKAYEHVKARHTWQQRIRELTALVEQLA